MFFEILGALIISILYLSLFKNNGIHDFQQRSINYNVLIDSSGVNKKIPLILSIKNPNEQDVYQIRKINEINMGITNIKVELDNTAKYN